MTRPRISCPPTKVEHPHASLSSLLHSTVSSHFSFHGPWRRSLPHFVSSDTKVPPPASGQPQAVASHRAAKCAPHCSPGLLQPVRNHHKRLQSRFVLPAAGTEGQKEPPPRKPRCLLSRALLPSCPVGISHVCWDQTVPRLLPGQWGWESHQQLPKKSTRICQREFLAA